jgi:hypothetical protein
MVGQASLPVRKNIFQFVQDFIVKSLKKKPHRERWGF